MSDLVGGDGRTHIESRLMRESLQNKQVLVGHRQRSRPADLSRRLAGLDRRPDHLRPRQGRDPAARRGARRDQGDKAQDGDRRRRRHARAPHDRRSRSTSACRSAASRSSSARWRSSTRSSSTRCSPSTARCRCSASTSGTCRSTSTPASRRSRSASRRTTSGSRRPTTGRLPMHGSDFGLFQLAEVLGMKQVIFVKDEDGLYDKDPKKHTDAKKYRQDHARRADQADARREHPRRRAVPHLADARRT